MNGCKIRRAIAEIAIQDEDMHHIGDEELQKLFEVSLVLCLKLRHCIITQRRRTRMLRCRKHHMKNGQSRTGAVNIPTLTI